MEEQIISIAKEKGFISNIIGKSVEAKYSNKDFYYLWMCELQKWLREVHNTYIAIIPGFGDKIWYTYQIHADNGNAFIDVEDSWDTYESALEESLKQGLLLINN